VWRMGAISTYLCYCLLVVGLLTWQCSCTEIWCVFPHICLRLCSGKYFVMFLMCLGTNMISFTSWLPFPLETLLIVTYWLENMMCPKVNLRYSWKQETHSACKIIIWLFTLWPVTLLTDLFQFILQWMFVWCW